MTPAQLQSIEETFQAALECQRNERNAFLESRCAGDSGLRTTVEALLASHEKENTFVETSIAAVAANLIGHRERESLIGKTIAHYHILKRIGAGGMGEVYLATDMSVGRNAALKVLPSHVSTSVERLRRFEQEARALAGLNHPNIMTIYEVGADDSRRYIASELIEGETLRQRLARGRIELSKAIDVASQVATALAAAHSAGVIHRDIKPDNIMLRPDGYVKVLDFGIAKLAEGELPRRVPEYEGLKSVETHAGAILGTVRYMSPEQASDGTVDGRADIWSVGVVLYEMLSGSSPFSGDTPREVLSTICEQQVTPLREDTPAELRQIVTRTLAKNPEQRYQNANELLGALKAFQRQLEFAEELKQAGAFRPWMRWVQWPTAVTVALLAAVFVLMVSLFFSRNAAVKPLQEKSIAVLPFVSLSQNEQDAYLADGIQDEILSNLAKIADLKVISRTSTMQYKGGASRNLREIGQQLGTANVVEGSVLRSGNRLHVNVQLIDAHSDAHLWGQSYDREIADVFRIQNEIAEAIAAQLRVKLSPAEQKAIQSVPTTDVDAFDLYSRAKDLLIDTTLSSDAKADLLRAAELLNQAVARDPSFFAAYSDLAYADDTLYFSGYDHTSARLALAEGAIQAAFRLRPEAGETHLAKAWNFYSGYLDYDGAFAELDRARQSLPNDPRIFQLIAFIQRRQGHWDESTRNLERAVTLDPRNVYTLQQIALSYDYLRRYTEEESALDRVLAITPDDIDAKIGRGWTELNWHADTKPLRQMIDSIRSTNPAAMSRISDAWLLCALSEHDIDSARDALVFAEEKPHVSTDNVALSRLFLEGVIARMTNDNGKALSAFTAARAEQEKIVQAQPTYGPAVCLLGLIDAGLGQKEKALYEGRQAIELLPVKKDAINGAAMIKYMSVIAAWTGETDLACQQLEKALSYPSFLAYGQLKLLPFWDLLRGDPRFEGIVASLAPK
jgi:eukaryotic-like serine/threonine-protein kinase